MSLLKRFGAMVSNLRRKTDRTSRKKRRSRLRTTLFVQPLAIIVLSFAVILILFNFALGWFIDAQAESAVQNQYNILDALFLGNTNSGTSQGNIFETTYIIVDEDFETKYVSASMDDVSEHVISQQISHYIYDHEQDWEFFDDDYDEEDIDLSDATSPSRITLNGSTYVLEMEKYTGVLNNYYIKQDSSSDKSQTYYVFVFANITAVRELNLWINILLLILMCITGLIASLFIYLTSRKLDRAFGSLKDYITRVGNRQANLTAEVLPYQEFNEVSATVENMSHMIDANQRSQQIFFQNSSHELRTPLMSIQGYAEGIREGVVKDDKEAAGVIYDESQKMAELVDDILTLSKVETTQTQLQLEKISLADLIYDVSWRLKAKADANQLVFVHDFEDDYLEIEADEKLIERALMNVLSNALRYAKKTITISFKVIGEQVQIVMANDGEPILPEDQDHLFERFYKGKSGHFGIGLALTKEIIDRHGGQISVTSDDNWTVFTILLPLSQ